jgi:hypothetical protein
MDKSEFVTKTKETQEGFLAPQTPLGMTGSLEAGTGYTVKAAASRRTPH